jgi:Ribbon-helix-helix domain
MLENHPFQFTENTTRWRSFDQTVQIVKTRHAGVKADELQAAIDEACEAVRDEIWPQQPAP